jgi:acyl-CoA synthetase (AMP-forming)/AMP-acid ligase II
MAAVKADGDTLAFLQYTSGSTADPKGVMVSHDNLMHNERMIQRTFRQTEQSIIVSWLPLYHDMGLIGTVLQTISVGSRCLLMSPTSFLQHPLLWLETISRYRATTSGGPNFAYELCVRKITGEQREKLDLGSWTVAFNGSEPVRAETLERFASAFAACGFRRAAFHPCYGLAESTLLVSGERQSPLPLVKKFAAQELGSHKVVETTGEAGGIALVGCGTTMAEQKIVIANPETLMTCAGGEVGEVWVSSPSVAQGYWQRPLETERIFQARLADTFEGPFLRTGDLGFICERELFITGRLKDLLIIRGRNHYPQDIEATVEQCHAASVFGGCAAFSVDLLGRTPDEASEEGLVLVLEAKRARRQELETVFADIRQA